MPQNDQVKLKPRQVAPLRKEILKQQGGRCALCPDFIDKDMSGRNACLDHDHMSGHVRAVLCSNCNGMEGKIWNLLRRMAGIRPGNKSVGYSDAVDTAKRLVAYWEKHQEDQTGYIHPTHKTEEEKRLKRNADARRKRLLAKARQNIR